MVIRLSPRNRDPSKDSALPSLPKAPVTCRATRHQGHLFASNESHFWSLDSEVYGWCWCFFHGALRFLDPMRLTPRHKTRRLGSCTCTTGASTATTSPWWNPQVFFLARDTKWYDKRSWHYVHQSPFSGWGTQRKNNVSAATKGALDVDESIFSSMSLQYLLRIAVTCSCWEWSCPDFCWLCPPCFSIPNFCWLHIHSCWVHRPLSISKQFQQTSFIFIFIFISIFIYLYIYIYIYMWGSTDCPFVFTPKCLSKPFNRPHPIGSKVSSMSAPRSMRFRWL